MNTFGSAFRVSLFGESHGEGLGVTIDGCPAGLPIDEAFFGPYLERRRGGGAGSTPRAEEDKPKLLTGIFNGHSTGAPITILFENKNVRSADYEGLRATPRPGHADYVLQNKHGGFNDPRGGGHSSGRLTLGLVAAGCVARKLLPDISITAHVAEAGGDTDVERAVQRAIEQQDSIGGIVECEITGVPAGLGDPFFDSLESAISHAVFSIPAIKGIGFGSGFDAARMMGLEHNDAIVSEDGRTATNHAGGINGGISNGNPILFKVAVKPTSSTPKTQRTWNTETKSVEELTIKGRHDLCIALRVPVVVESVAAMVLADMMIRYEGVRAMGQRGV
jgi:chorismate synthase